MQYKIPVQIENEDSIFLWLSLRQLLIITIYIGIWYVLYSSLVPRVWQTMSLIPAVFIWIIWVVIALFKASEMTFLPFVLNLLRFNINAKNRYWWKWVDSFGRFEIWYIVKTSWAKKIVYKRKEITDDKLDDAISKI